MLSDRKIGIVKKLYAMLVITVEGMDELKGMPFYQQEVKMLGNRFQKAMERRINESYDYLYKDDQNMVQFNRIAALAEQFSKILSRADPQQFSEINEMLNTHEKKYEALHKDG